MKVKFIKVLDERSGEGKNGTWHDLQFLTETVEGNFPKKMALNAKSEEIIGKIKAMKEGDVFNVSYDINSNEYNGKYYTKVNVWKIHLEAGDPPTSAYTGAGGDENDGLPF